jgi:hypothetical protein
MRSVLLIPLLLALSACSSGPYPVSSPYYLIPAGSKVVLKQELTILPNAARVYIQYGRVVSPIEKNNYYAHCSFLSWQVLGSEQLIKPDTFIVIETRHLEDIVQLDTGRQLASNVLAYGVFGDSAPQALVYSTELTIHSDTQPDIRRFICSYWENPGDAQHITVAQIQQALGNIAEIQLNLGK